MTNGFTEVIAHYLFSFEGTKPSKSKSGDYSGEVTPVPISNTVVKLLCADDTWREAARESRSLPVFILWPHGQAVKTSPFHGGNSGSIPDGVTILNTLQKVFFYWNFH